MAAEGQPFDPEPARGGDARARRRRAEPIVIESRCAPATCGRVGCCARPWSRCRADRDPARVRGSRPLAPQREWFEKDYYKVLGVARRRRQGDHAAPTASSPASCTPTPTRTTRGRGAVQGGLRGLRRGRRRGQAQGVRRGPPARAHGWRLRWRSWSGRLRRGRAGRRWRRLRPRPTSATCSAACSAGAAARGGGLARARSATWRRPRDRVAPVLRRGGVRGHDHGQPHDRGGLQHLHGQRGQAGHDPAGHLPPVPRPGRARRQPGLLLVQPAVSRSARGRGTSIDEPVPHLSGVGLERRPRQVKVRIPAGVKRRPAHPAQGPGRRRAATVAPPATSTWWSTWHPTRSSVATATTSRSRCRSPSPRRRWAPRSRCRPSTAPRSRSSCPRAPARARSSGSRARASRPARATGDLLVTVEVAVPQKLSKEQRAAVEALAAAETESPRTHLGV